MEFKHYPVMLEECIEGLNIKQNGTYIDATLGGAGHTTEILKRLTSGKLIALDRDINAIENARQKLSDYGEKLKLIHTPFSLIKEKIQEHCRGQAEGILFDLGVSSHQLDEATRGFSYSKDAPLNMRMDETETLTAEEVVNTYSYEELKRILFTYGEEKYSPLIAKAIVEKREKEKIKTTIELAEIIKNAMPKKALLEKQHPAKRSFQAIRIEVNSELKEIETALEKSVDLLSTGGRLCVISFHSLEDRIVKSIMQKYENPCTCPPDFPVCICKKQKKLQIITRKPILPTEKELLENPRSRSAKLRIAQKI